MNQKLAYLLFAFAFVVALVVGFGPEEPERLPPAAVRARVLDSFRKREPPAPADSLRKPERSPSSDRGAKPAMEAPMKSEALPKEAFLRKYGERLRLVEHQARVHRIEGLGIPAETLEREQKVAGFSPARAEALLARAREILADTRDLLGVAAQTQFAAPIVNPGQLSGQVIFQQSIDGVPITPGGLVTIVVGPEGELRTLDSSIHPSIQVVNVRGPGTPAYTREILYVTQSSPVATAHYAYETRNNGIQKVVDAQTQEVLLERDRRIHFHVDKNKLNQIK